MSTPTTHAPGAGVATAVRPLFDEQPNDESTPHDASSDSEGAQTGPEVSIRDEAEIVRVLSQEINANIEQVRATLTLLEDGATVPFIARYRKEVTQNLNEVQIRLLNERRRYFSDLLARRATIVSTIESQGLLTAELRASIEGCLERTRLEDLYLPYRPKRRTRAMVAVEKGLEPLARVVYQQSEHDTAVKLNEAADALISDEKGLANRDEVFAGVRDVIAEWIAEDADLRQIVRDLMFREGEVRSKVRSPRATEAAAEAPAEAGASDERARARAARAAQKAREREEALARYKIYHDFHESVRTIPSHRIMAIRRAAREEILTYSVEIDTERALQHLRPHLIVNLAGPHTIHVEAALVDAYNRLMKPSIETEVKQALRKQADNEAIRVFTENLENLLLTPPGGSLVVMGLDPGFRTGCKVAVVDTTGKLIDHATIYPTEPRNDERGAEKVLNSLIDRYGVGAIAIGNGTASRETHSFVRRMIAKRANSAGLFAMVVNEAGASVYSASDEAREEFPDLDVTVRGAVSIARRLQDPLAELVKIDPRSLGVGQYQHDIDQKRLRQALHDTVESCVNRVGVDLNTASVALLRYVAGIGEKVAQAIVKRRDDSGPFGKRNDLLSVTGIGPKTFEQAAGFLRIRDGAVALDNTGVHPESYAVVDAIARSLGIDVDLLIHTPEKLTQVNKETVTTETQVGGFTLSDILDELGKPGRDPREKFVVPEFREDVHRLEDLSTGMELEGTVTNVANFGAFVDIGVHQDGLVHVSELSHRFVQDPREVVRVGDIVKVRVLSVDHDRKRIALSMKAVGSPEMPVERPQQRREPVAPRPRPQHDRGFDGGHRGDERGETRTFSAPTPAPASAQVEAPSNYVPGSWKRSTASPTAAPSKARAKALKTTTAATKAVERTATETPSEVSERIRLLQERFNRNR
ncbi:MAG: S1 RNA-binding domain-containing protein [Proteobacteria bacterium]|nr:S1 RNA-binding domain-containing protein [Pseudomonadota bacterium]